VGTRCADHVTPLYPQKLALTSPTGGGHSVGIVRVRTKSTEFRYTLQLLDDLKDRRGYSLLKEEALDRTMWRNRYRGGFGPVVRQNTE